jgi:hypothetical protein
VLITSSNAFLTLVSGVEWHGMTWGALSISPHKKGPVTVKGLQQEVSTLKENAKRALETSRRVLEVRAKENLDGVKGMAEVRPDR